MGLSWLGRDGELQADITIAAAHAHRRIDAGLQAELLAPERAQVCHFVDGDVGLFVRLQQHRDWHYRQLQHAIQLVQLLAQQRALLFQPRACW